jgi:hypothetical protein
MKPHKKFPMIASNAKLAHFSFSDEESTQNGSDLSVGQSLRNCLN